MRLSASSPHLNSPIFFPLWEAVGHLGRVICEDGELCVRRAALFKCGDFAGVVKGACPLLVALCVVVTL